MNESSVPQHIGYIMDGNRRWAEQHGLPAYEGHLAGYTAMKEVLTANIDAGVKYVSVYAFSSENWRRSQAEVDKLMKLLVKCVKTDAKYLHDRQVRVVVLGSRDQLPEKVVQAIEEIESATAHYTKGTLALCFNYGGQQEIVNAVKRIIASGVTEDQVTADLIEQNLYSPEIPPCDLIVRTSGEQRLSNFMLWRSALSEFLFLKKHWPDMRAEDVKNILDEYAKRNRRFGG